MLRKHFLKLIIFEIQKYKRKKNSNIKKTKRPDK